MDVEWSVPGGPGAGRPRPTRPRGWLYGGWAGLDAVDDHFYEVADETIGEREVAQQQAVLGRAEQQVEDALAVGVGRDLTPADRPVQHDPVLLAERLEHTLAVAGGQVLV